MIGRKHSIHSFWNYSGMKGAVQGACLSPQYDAHEQGPPEVTGGKSQGKRHRVCQRGETGSTHVCEDMERWKVKGWKKTEHPKESRGDCYIRQNKLKKKKKLQLDNYCIMTKWSIYQKAVTNKNIYTSNIRYLRKMKQTLNRHVQTTWPNKSIKHMYLKDT